jgi:hypothetical protein
MSMRRWSWLVMPLMISLIVWRAHAGWFSDERPPANAKKLSEIVKTLEDQGLGGITEIEFEDGVWKIEVHNPDGSETDLRVDPVSGQILPRQ